MSKALLLKKQNNRKIDLQKIEQKTALKFLLSATCLLIYQRRYSHPYIIVCIQ